MKRLVSVALAFVMAATVYAVPVTSAYANDEPTSEEVVTTVDENTQQEPAEGNDAVDQSEPADPSEPTVSVDAVDEPQAETTELGQVTGFVAASQNASAIKVKWDALAGAEGYKIYKNDGSNWAEVADVAASKKEATVSGLDASTGYSFMIKAYVGTGDALTEGQPSATLETATTPAKVTISSLKKSFPTLKVKWNEKKGSGYEIWVSKSSKFKSKKKINIDSQSEVSSKLGKLTNNKKYYVKVRAVFTYKGVTYKGSWSKVKSAKVKSTGWYKSSSSRRYYYKNGTTIKGYHKFNGTTLYFDKSSGELVGVTKAMWDNVKSKSSGTNKLVSVSRAKNRYVVYKKVDGHWCVYKWGLCTTGKKSTPTPKGNFSTTGKDKIKFGSGFTCWYATNIVGNVYFHSVICATGTKRASGGQLGRSLSHGCIRLSISDAKWIYTHIGKGTKIVIL